MRNMTKQNLIKALALVLILLGWVIGAMADNILDEFLAGANELPEGNKMLQLHNRDVIAYFDMRELNTPLKVKNFQKTDAYKTKLAELDQIREAFYSGPVYARLQLSFGEYKLSTKKINAPIQCPGDFLARKTYNGTIAYFDDPKVFCGVTFSALTTSTLPANIRNVGMEYYALELQVSEEVATFLEGSYPEIYLIGKISSSKQAKIFEYDYWEGLSSGMYPVPTVAKEAPVIANFKLVIYDDDTDTVIYSKDFKAGK
jgi:hypothetical protein